VSKYGSKKHTCSDGRIMDSKREAKRYEELLLLQKLGEITELETQVEYVLIPKQRSWLRTERACTYTLDFRYRDKAGVRHHEDSKGMKTQQYVIRRKLMLQVHSVSIEEV
jgi:hypothetical protein